MAASVLVDSGFLVALLSRRDAHHRWSEQEAQRHPPPWKTCEAVLSETFHLIGAGRATPLRTLLTRGAVTLEFDLGTNLKSVLKFMQKYGNLPASLADASLVRMTETLHEPLLLTTDTDFRVYRKNDRQVVPCVMPR